MHADCIGVVRCKNVNEAMMINVVITDSHVHCYNQYANTIVF